MPSSYGLGLFKVCKSCGAEWLGPDCFCPECGQDTTQPAKKRWLPGHPGKCQLCGEWLIPGEGNTFIDGRMRTTGQWTIMCSDCHTSVGVGLGLGKGQKYDAFTLYKLEG